MFPDPKMGGGGYTPSQGPFPTMHPGRHTALHMPYICHIYGRFYGGGKVVPTQSGRFLSPRRFSQKCRAVGGSMLYLFEYLQEMAVSERYGFGRGRWPCFFVPDPNLFGVLVSAPIMWSGLVRFIYRVSRCLAWCSNMSLVWQISVPIVNDADFYAESTGEGPTLQVNDMLEKIIQNCVQAYAT